MQRRARRGRWRQLAGALALLASLASAAAPAPLRVLVEDDAEPFSRRDGSGYANEVVKAAFAAAGVAVELQVVPYARCKALVLSAAELACFSMSWQPEFEGVVQFARYPLFSVTPVYFQNRKKMLAASNEEQIGRGVRVGVVNGYEYPASALRVAGRGAQLVAARSEQVNLKKLALGRLDAALVMDNPLHGAAFWVREAGVEQDVVATFASTRMDAYLGFALAHPQGRWALDKFNQGYATLLATDALKAIEKRWAYTARGPGHRK